MRGTSYATSTRSRRHGPAISAALLVLLPAVTSCNPSEGSHSGADSRASATQGTETKGTETQGTEQGGSGPQPTPGGLDRRLSLLQEIVRTNVDAGVLPGAVVVVRQGNRSRSYAHGYADQEAHTRLTVRHRFPIASITKSMTATVVMRLVSQGRMALDDTVGRWLPGVLPRARSVTVEQLLSHGSGLPEIDDGPLLAKGNATPREAVAQIATKPLEFPPGSNHVYRNANFVVLGLVIEAVTGEPYARTLERWVFRPAGLRSAAVREQELRAPPFVTGYANDEPWPLIDLSFAAPAGAVTGTARDVSDFYAALFHGELVKPAAVAEMTRLRAPSFQPWGAYALGLAMHRSGCGPVYGHEGRLPGFASMAWTDLRTDRSVVLVTNTGSDAVLGSFAAAVGAAICA
jgi:D-alanyl-D-alanine carboxypeptidase